MSLHTTTSFAERFLSPMQMTQGHYCAIVLILWVSACAHVAAVEPLPLKDGSSILTTLEVVPSSALLAFTYADSLMAW